MSVFAPLDMKIEMSPLDWLLQPYRAMQDGAYCSRIGLGTEAWTHFPQPFWFIGWWCEEMEQIAAKASHYRPEAK